MTASETPKTFSRTYEIEAGDLYAPLTKEQRAGLTNRLRADAKKEKVEGVLGETAVVSRVTRLGRTSKVTVRATVGPKGKPE